MALLGAVCWAFGKNRFAATTTAAIEPPPLSPPAAVVQMHYEQHPFGLPIQIEPNTSATMIIITPSRAVGFVNEINNDNKVLKWPTSLTVFPPETTGEIVLSNHGDKAVFDLSSSIALRIGAGRDAKRTVVNLPVVDNLDIGGAPTKFYIVNQSSYAAVVDLPTFAEAQIQGDSGRESVKIERRKVTFLDRVPIVLPSSHRWIGNNIVIPDDRKRR